MGLVAPQLVGSPRIKDGTGFFTTEPPGKPNRKYFYLIPIREKKKSSVSSPNTKTCCNIIYLYNYYIIYIYLVNLYLLPFLEKNPPNRIAVI